MEMRKYLITSVVLFFCFVQLVTATLLDEYIGALGENYSYSLAKTVTGRGYTAYVIDMTSQSWRSRTEVNRTLWRHRLTIIKPDQAAGNKALLWITGGNNDEPTPTHVDQMLLGIALGSNSVVTELRMVPNQPLVFPDGGGPKYEDAIIAYTFDKYFTTADANWPLLLPMVKSAVRAMDTVQDYLSSLDSGALDVNEFVVSGGSKRGWTTWLTAAVDERVIAIVPVVIDVLNMKEQMKHHFSAYGFYSDAIEDYVEKNIFDRLGTPEGLALMEIVDPYRYRGRYTMPKYLINSTGDQFFLPDSSQFYFRDLPGEKYLRYVPNTDHSLGGSDADKSLMVFYEAVLGGLPRPEFSWVVKDDDSIEINTVTSPVEVKLWQASNPEARDFRLETIGSAWTSSTLGGQSNGLYIAKVEQPQQGWKAFFVELTFESGLGVPYKFTTQVHVVPDTLLYASQN